MDDTLLADGFEDAFMGFFQRVGKPRVIAYDYEKCIKILMERDGMEEDEADEYLQFNTVGAWVGEGTPAFIYPMDYDKWQFNLELEDIPERIKDEPI
tara:strand:+ start:555 stop:845 length:291 start_codon:yes stop_codon:yes gene_type:complete